MVFWYYIETREGDDVVRVFPLRHVIWAMTIVVVVFMLCMTVWFASLHPYTIRFEMDNNTLEAIKSIKDTAPIDSYDGSIIWFNRTNQNNSTGRFVWNWTEGLQ